MKQAYALALALALLAALPALARPATLRVPLVLHVAEGSEGPVAAESFIAEQLATANALYGPLGLELVVHERRTLPARHAELVTRADRDALARYVRPGAVHWFVVGKLMDVDEPGRERRGVHWHSARTKGRRFVIVSKISGPYVLAHELGHYFGNPEHSPVPGNLMSYERTDAAPFLDDAQIRRVRSTLASMIERGSLRPLPAQRP